MILLTATTLRKQEKSSTITSSGTCINIHSQVNNIAHFLAIRHFSLIFYRIGTICDITILFRSQLVLFGLLNLSLFF